MAFTAQSRIAEPIPSFSTKILIHHRCYLTEHELFVLLLCRPNLAFAPLSLLSEDGHMAIAVTRAIFVARTSNNQPMGGDVHHPQVLVQATSRDTGHEEYLMQCLDIWQGVPGAYDRTVAQIASFAVTTCCM